MRDSAPRRRGLRAAVSLVAWLALSGAAQVHAAGNPAEVCRVQQLLAADVLYKSSYVCWAKAFTTLGFDPFKCLVKAEDRFRSIYAAAATRAENAGKPCALKMPVESLLSLAAGGVDPEVGAIAGSVDLSNTTDRKLRAKRIAFAAVFAARAFAAELVFAKDQDDARLAQNLSNARNSLTAGFAAMDKVGSRSNVVYDGTSADSVADSLSAAAALWERITRSTNGSFIISGTVFAAEASFVDSDVNDTNTYPLPNGTEQAAQALPVPSTVGGYVNQVQAGPKGNSFGSGDVLDKYLVSLREGQVIVLVLGDDPSEEDLDLRLTPTGAAPTAIKVSEGTGPLEILVAPADGDYYIDVFPATDCMCGGTYTLSIGQTVPPAAAKAERTDVEFVPGQLIVKLRAADAPAAGLGALRAAAAVLPQDLGLQKLAGDASREMLVQLPEGDTRVSTFQALGAANARQMLATQSISNDELAREETLLALKALRKRPEIESAQLNTIMRPSIVPADTYYGLQWDLPLIHLPQAWDLETGSPNVIVAVVDTGVLLNHPDLQGKLVAGYDFIMDRTRARDGNGIDPDPNDPGDRGAGAASSFHGTHVTGTIAAATNNDRGIAGISWSSKVMPVRVLGLNGGTQYDVMQGVRYAAGLPNDSGTVPPQKADIINLSLGGGGSDPVAQGVFNDVYAAGVLVVAAAGNDASSLPAFPASYDHVISVAAVDLNRNPAPYSNFGDHVDVAAPGGDTSVDRNGDGYADGILSTLADDSVSPLAFVYAFYQGTSMATPHVAGVLALMRSVKPTLSPDDVDALLAQGKLTEDLLGTGRDDRTGWGLIDARAAVVAAGAVVTGPLVPLSVTPSGLNFGLTIDDLLFNVTNAGSDTLVVTSVSVENQASAPWLTVAPDTVDGGGFGTYRATVTRALGDGSYAATIVIVSNSGTVRIPVVMRVGGATSSDTGYQYILLVDAQTLEPIDEVALGAIEGAYPYVFTNVPQGKYLLISGSDLDNDDLICDGGEACGSFPTLDLPTPITVDRNLAGEDFGTAFRQSFTTSAPLPTGAGLSKILR